MSHFFYKYEIYNKDNQEYTLLKWVENGEYDNCKKIDKPTSDLSADDLLLLQHFIDDGMVVQDKSQIEIPPDNPGTNMI